MFNECLLYVKCYFRFWGCSFFLLEFLFLWGLIDSIYKNKYMCYMLGDYKCYGDGLRMIKGDRNY